MSQTLQTGLKQYQRAPTTCRAIHIRRQLRLLCVGRNPAEVELWLQELKRAQVAVRADLAQTREEFTERLRSQSYDVVLAEDSLSGWKGMDALELLRGRDEEIPFVLLTDTVLRADIAEEFINEGVSDCVDKGHLVRLPMAVAVAVNQKSLREERNRAQKELRRRESHYRALVDNPIYGICRCTVDGKFLEGNQAMAVMLGYESQEELLELNLATDIIHDSCKGPQLFEHYLQMSRVDHAEVRCKRKDGTSAKVALSGREVRDDQGAVEGFEIIAMDVTEQHAVEEQLRYLAASDPLTGLANYRRLTEVLDIEIRRSDRSGRPFAVLLFDLDGLKQINDSWGHLAGNRALCRLAESLRHHCRSIDTAARYGGDEFALVLPETQERTAGLAVRRICCRLADDHQAPALSVSVGVAVHPHSGKTIENLLCAADEALYEAKGRRKDLYLESAPLGKLPAPTSVLDCRDRKRP
jgi:diguanylate cyclase (GGDEF)-like protein/PAS domain S-box-containing protein